MSKENITAVRGNQLESLKSQTSLARIFKSSVETLRVPLRMSGLLHHAFLIGIMKLKIFYSEDYEE